MPIIQNGQGLEIAVPPGQSIAISSIAGTYSATLLDGAGRGDLAVASTGGATYGPYPAGATLRVKAGVDSYVAYDVGVSPSAVANPVATFETNASGDVLGLRAPDGRHIEVEGTTDQEAAQFRASGGVVAAFYYGEWITPGVIYRPSPWASMQPYPDRLPVLSQKIAAGVYGLPGDDAASVLWEQEQAMAAGVDVFVHNVYWFDPDGGTNYRNMCHASLDQHAACPTDHKFCIQYSNHGVSPVSTPAQFNALIEYWFGFINGAPSKYWKINGKPVIYIYDTQEFQRMASVVFGLPNTQVAMTQALASMKAHAAVFGIPGLFIVSQSASDSPYWIGNKYGHIGAIDASGLDAATRYNRLWTYTDRWQTPEGVGADYDTRFPQPLTGFEQLAEVYRNADNWIVNESGSGLPFFVPAICGWDRRPWKEDASHGLDAVNSEDNCAASPEQWLQHLRTQRGFALAGTRGAPGVPPVVNMYAWNEYGEGGFLCPSRRYGWQMLDQIKRAMGVTA